MRSRVSQTLFLLGAVLFFLSCTNANSQSTTVTHGKRAMRIVLVLPFELEKNFPDTADFPGLHIDPASLAALNFYEGALLAIDSLKRDSILVKVESCDTPADSFGVVKLFTNPKMKEADLVIGSFPGTLTQVASFCAARYGIKLMLTQSTSPVVVNSRSDVAIALASTHTQCRIMADFMISHFPKARVILVYRSMKREDELAAVFRDELMKTGMHGSLAELNVSRNNITELDALIDTTVRNIVFVVSSDEAFVSPVLTQLEARNQFGIQVSGLPTWQQFESIDFMGFKNLQLYVFDNNYIDYESGSCHNIRTKFLHTYSSDPMPQAFNGFDIILNAGKSFNQDPTNILGRLEQWNGSGCGHFEFLGAVGSGKENQHIAVLRFIEYRLELLNKE